MVFTFRFSNLSQYSIASPVVDSIPAEYQPGKFELPIKLKHVRKQTHRAKPQRLPDHNASKEEVKFFLYQLLTFEAYTVSRKWPQWILETCAAWGKRCDGTGAELRVMTTSQLRNICPLDSNHAKIKNKRKDPLTSAPAPQCHYRIGEAVAMEVKQFKKREEDQIRLQQEWREARLGGTARRLSAAHGVNTGDSASLHSGIKHYTRPGQKSTMDVVHECGQAQKSGANEPWLRRQASISQDLITHLTGHLYTRPYSQSMTNMSQHRHPQACIQFTQSTSNLNATASDNALRLIEAHGNLSSGQVAISELPAIPLPSLRHTSSNSSGNTASTAKTTPRASIEEILSRKPPSPQRLSSASILSRTHRSPASLSSPEVANEFLSPIQTPNDKILTKGDYCTQHAHQSEHLPTGYSRVHTTHPPLNNLSPTSSLSRRLSAPSPRIIHLSPGHEQYTSFQQRNFTRPQGFASVENHVVRPSFSRVSLAHGPSSPSLPQRSRTSASINKNRAAINKDQSSLRMTSGNDERLASVPETEMHTMNFSRPSYVDLRHNSSPLPMSSSRLSPKYVKYPDLQNEGGQQLRRSPSPVHSYTPRPRSVVPSKFSSITTDHNNKRFPVISSHAVSSAERDALEQDKCFAWQAKDSLARCEIAASEFERMRGNIPSSLHRERPEALDPTLGYTDHHEGQFKTLVEVIHEKEVLSRRKQRGSALSGALDSDPMKNMHHFFRGTGC